MYQRTKWKNRTQRIIEWLDLVIKIEGTEVEIVNKKYEPEKKQRVPTFICTRTYNRDQLLLKGLASSKATRLNQIFFEKYELKTTEKSLTYTVAHEVMLWKCAGWSREIIARLFGRIRVAPRMSRVFRQTCKNCSY